jgi:hypothetical protein
MPDGGAPVLFPILLLPLLWSKNLESYAVSWRLANLSPVLLDSGVNSRVYP